MSKIQNFAEITPNLPFSEFNFHELYRATFENSELGRMKKILPLHKMAESFGLVRNCMTPKRGAAGGEVDGATTGGSRIVGKPRRFRNGVLTGGLLDESGKTTRNPGDEARTQRPNSIKRQV